MKQHYSHFTLNYRSRRMLAHLTVWLCLLLGVHWASAQQVEGTVKDVDDLPLVGANIIVKGTQTGAITNEAGYFTLNVQEGQDSLIVSYIGYTTQVVAVDVENPLSIVLTESTTSLGDVVITALGIERETKALGYAVQEVQGDALDQARETNLVNSLAGRIAGVNVTSGSAGIGTSSRITIRGESSLAGDNQPLFIVDGIPINNQIFGSEQSGQDIDYGNGVAAINPDDIESINVLKGPNAAALYGSRAANGVIIITTKSARGKRGFGVNFNSTTTFESVLKLPDFQNEYGQGRGGVYNIGDGGRSWGPPLDGRLVAVPVNTEFPPQNGEETVWEPYPDNVKNFYETGRTLVNNISINAANENADVRLSYTNHNQTGIIPNTDLRRNTVSLNGGVNVGDKIRVNAVVNYIKTDSDQRPVVSYGNESVVYTMLWEGRQVRTPLHEDYWFEGLEGLQPFTYNFRFNDNPYYTMYENLNPQDKDRVMGNINLNYQITPELSLLLRSGMDYFNDKRENLRTFGSRAFPNGAYRQDRIAFEERNSDFLLTYNKVFDNVWGVKVSGGANRMDQRRSYISARANELSLPGVYNLGNSRIPVQTEQFDSHKRINSVYGFAEISYNNALFLQLTARNDWSSTLPADNNAYFYPSVNVSAVLSDLFNFSTNSVVSFAKLRAGWAEVGNDTDPYNLRNVYNYGTAWGSLQTATESSVIANEELRPESINTYEIGADIRFFNNRLGLDVTYYDIRSKDQILNIPLDIVSGYTGQFINAGEIKNQGLEVILNATPIKRSNGLQWDINLNWSMNRSEVLELAEGIETYQISGRYVQVLAKVGERMGDMYGQIFQRVEEGPFAGQIIHINGEAQTTTDIFKVGNYNPDWLGGIYNTFTYKGFKLGFLFDIRFGGEIYSRTNVIGNQAGQLVESLPGRENGYVGEGVMLDADGNYVPNDVNIPAERYWGGGSYFRRSNVENSTFDATFTKLREVQLGYTFPNKLFGSTPFRDLSITLVGRNLLLWTDVPHIDPETNSLDGGTFLPGVESLQVPSTRSYGVNVRFRF